MVLFPFEEAWRIEAACDKCPFRFLAAGFLNKNMPILFCPFKASYSQVVFFVTYLSFFSLFWPPNVCRWAGSSPFWMNCS